MVSMQWETRPSMQRDEPPTMETGLERIAERARCEPKLRFTSLAHHITEDRVWKSLCQIPNHSAPEVDGQGVSEAKESFEGWVGVMLQSIHRKGYRAPDIRRVYIPKPGKQEKRPLGVPTVSDWALQRSTSQVLSAVAQFPAWRGAVRPAAVGSRTGVRPSRLPGTWRCPADQSCDRGGCRIGDALRGPTVRYARSGGHRGLSPFRVACRDRGAAGPTVFCPDPRSGTEPNWRGT